MQQKHYGILSIPVIIGALGYFVDIYDLLLFTIVRIPSLKGLGVLDAAQQLNASTSIINHQMIGLLIGGIIWGTLGDRKGRLSVLFGSILLYSVANFYNGYVTSIEEYTWCRFIAGIGLAGELGAGITLVSELLPKHKRGIGTSLVAGIGLSGAVAAYFVYKFSGDWRLCYKIGGGLGALLLLLRVSVAESGMFKQVKESNVSRGNFLLFFTQKRRFKKYILAILIGLPTWFVIGILINLSNQFAFALFGEKTLESGRAIMYGYVAISIGDILAGFVSQWFKSRKMVLYICYAFAVLVAFAYFNPSINHSNNTMYFLCAMLGLATGYWAIFVTMGAEQFGTNLRATAATTIPNMVRGALPLMNLFFKDYLIETQKVSFINSAIITGSIVISIAVVAVYFTEETFHKDLNYLETEDILP